MKKVVDEWEALPHFEQHVRCLPIVETVLRPCRWKCCCVIFLLIRFMLVMVDRFVASGPFCFLFSIFPWKLQVGLLCFFFLFFSVASLNFFFIFIENFAQLFSWVCLLCVSRSQPHEHSHEFWRFTQVYFGLFRSFFKFNLFFNLILQHLIYWKIIFMLLLFSLSWSNILILVMLFLDQILIYLIRCVYNHFNL